ncbi:hypothetical protein [Nocardia xishanensis]
MAAEWPIEARGAVLPVVSTTRSDAEPANGIEVERYAAASRTSSPGR